MANGKKNKLEKNRKLTIKKATKTWPLIRTYNQGTFRNSHIINILTELGRSVWENLELGRWYRHDCVRSVLAISVKILP